MTTAVYVSIGVYAGTVTSNVGRTPYLPTLPRFAPFFLSINVNGVLMAVKTLNVLAAFAFTFAFAFPAIGDVHSAVFDGRLTLTLVAGIVASALDAMVDQEKLDD